MASVMNWMALFLACVLGQSAPGEEVPIAPADGKSPPMISSVPTGNAQAAPIVPGLQPVDPTLVDAIRVELRPARPTVPVGSPVILEFTVINTTDGQVKLSVPGALAGKERPDLGMGLPLEHVYSAQGFHGLEISSETNLQMGDRVTRKPEYPIPPITIAPFATVGLRFDIARFYPGLHQAGTYVLNWRPYGGVVSAEPVVINVVAYKQVIIETEYGPMTMQLLYDKAPKHVANFLELVGKRFYNNKTFHEVYKNQFLIGGCPLGDGTGKRADGLTLAPEFNDTPFEVGTVGMALAEPDVQSASCQFFICLSRQAAWDGKYTAFAQVIGPQSLATLKKLAEVGLDEGNRPRKPLMIKSMVVQDAPFTPSSSQ